MFVRSRYRGFTLIELVVTVVAIAALAATAVVALGHFASRARQSAVTQSASSLMTAVAARAAAVDQSPESTVAALWGQSGGDRNLFLDPLGVTFDGKVSYVAAAGGAPARLKVLGDRAECSIALPGEVSAPPTLAGCGASSITGFDPLTPGAGQAGDTPGGPHTVSVTLAMSAGAVTLTDGAWKQGSMQGTYDPSYQSVKITGAAAGSNNVTVKSGDQDLVFDNLSINMASSTALAPVELQADAGRVTIRLSGESTLTAGGQRAGLEKDNGIQDADGTLTITSVAGDGDPSGKLTTTGGSVSLGDGVGVGGAGIGGPGTYTSVYNTPGGDGTYITVAGGTIVATGGSADSSSYINATATAGPGIGGNGLRGGSRISITGGVVTANGGSATGGNQPVGGAGIGGALAAAQSSYISVTGGTVTAKGGSSYQPRNGYIGYGGAGIGASGRAIGKHVAITGGTVTATGGTGNGYSGFGGAGVAAIEDIAISGGQVTAVGGYGAGSNQSGSYQGYGGAGVGSNGGQSVVGIAISGGQVKATGGTGYGDGSREKGGAAIGAGGGDTYNYVATATNVAISCAVIDAAGGTSRAAVGAAVSAGSGNAIAACPPATTLYKVSSSVITGDPDATWLTVLEGTPVATTTARYLRVQAEQ